MPPTDEGTQRLKGSPELFVRLEAWQKTYRSPSRHSPCSSQPDLRTASKTVSRPVAAMRSTWTQRCATPPTIARVDRRPWPVRRRVPKRPLPLLYRDVFCEPAHRAGPAAYRGRRYAPGQAGESWRFWERALHGTSRAYDARGLCATPRLVHGQRTQRIRERDVDVCACTRITSERHPRRPCGYAAVGYCRRLRSGLSSRGGLSSRSAAVIIRTVSDPRAI